MLDPAKLSFRNKAQTFRDAQNQSTVITTENILQEMLQGILQIEKKARY